MKQRIIKFTIQNKLNQKKLREQKCAQFRSIVFANEDILEAYSNYTSSAYNDFIMNNNEEPSSTTTKNYSIFLDLLKKHKYNIKDLNYEPICNKCGDTGVHEGTLCECTRFDYLDNLSKECEISKRAPFTYKDCNFDIIKDATQKDSLKKLYDLTKAYCLKYPKTKSNNIIFSGGVGTGKTCLASAMANEFIKRGYPALMMSAYEFNSTMLKCHTSNVEIRNDILHDILTCDLLVIDDLGTEPMLKNVTCEYLLTVISERVNNKLSTVITTNLTPSQILDKYGERIFSRLSDKAHSKIFLLKGKDLRH